MADAPQGPNFANLALQAQLAQETSPQSKAKDFNSLIDGMFGQSGSGIGLFIKAKLDSLFSTGILANVTPPQGWAEKPMNQAASGLSSRGGRLAEMLAMFKPDFGSISAPQMGGSMVDVSFASLGNLSAPVFAGGSSGVSAGIEVG